MPPRRLLPIAALVLLIVLEPCGAVLSKRQLRQRSERRSCRFVTATATGAAGYALASSLTETYTPPGLAVRPLLRTVLTPREQAYVTLAAALFGLAVGGIISRRDDVLCRAVRSVARAPVDAFDGIGERREKRKQAKEQAVRKEWARTHTQRAKIYMQ